MMDAVGMKKGLIRFVSENGSFASPNYEIRDRSTIEQVFLKPRNGKLPTFHVFPFRYLYNEYRGQKPISEQEWNKKFAPYFPEIHINGPYEPNEEDKEFAEKIHYFIAEYNDEMKMNEGGGLEHETEEIEVMELLFSKALKMISMGEICDAKTIILLQYAKINELL